MPDDFRSLYGDIYVQDGSREGGLGSFCWAPVFYTHEKINVVRAISSDPNHADFRKYNVVPVSLRGVGHEKHVPTWHSFRDAELRLDADEDLFVVRGKRRPVVVLFNPRRHFDAITKDNVKSPRDTPFCFGCVPAYTLVGSNGQSRHQAAFVANVRRLKYAPCCYLPEHPSLTDRESFLRVDRLVWIQPTLLEPMHFKLNSRGLKYVHAWFDLLATGSLPEELADVRDLLLSE